MQKRRLWCRVVGVGEKLAFGFTIDDEKVAVPPFGGIWLEKGDIVSFEPEPFNPTAPWEPGRKDGKPKYFGRRPILIGKNPHLPPTHAGQGAGEDYPEQVGGRKCAE